MYGTGQMTTSSIEPPRPVEDMVQKPARPYDDGYSLGRHDEVPAAAAHQGRYQWNGNPDRLQEGTSTALPPAQANLAPDGRKLIVVRPGDTLYSISRQQGISIQDLMTANRLTGPTLSAGQTLVLPTTLR
jgi:LysM repeat protein